MGNFSRLVTRETFQKKHTKRRETSERKILKGNLSRETSKWKVLKRHFSRETYNRNHTKETSQGKLLWVRKGSESGVAARTYKS